MSQLQSIPIPFPTKGVNTSTGLVDQPPGTAPDARNVRLFDALDHRMRGGQRPGLVKFFDADLSVARAIVTATDGGGSEDELVVAGDHSAEFAQGRTLVIANSTANDGTYVTSSAAVYASVPDQTTISIPTASLTDETNDGDITSQPIGAPIDELLVLESILDADDSPAVEAIIEDDFDADSGWVDGDKLSQASHGAGEPTWWNEYADVGDVGVTIRQDGDAKWEIEDRDGELLAEFNLNTVQHSLTLDPAQAVIGVNYDIFMRVRGIGTGGGAPTLGFADRAALSAQPTDTLITPMFRMDSDWKTGLIIKSSGVWTTAGITNSMILYQLNGTGGEVLLESVLCPAANGDIFPDEDFPAEWIEFWVRVRSNRIVIKAKLSTQSTFTKLGTWTDKTELAGQTGVGVFTDQTTRQFALSRFELGTARVGPYGQRELRVFAFGNSEVWEGIVDTDDVLTQVTDGEAAPIAGNIKAIQLFGRIYAVDGTGGVIVEGTNVDGDSQTIKNGSFTTLVNWATEVSGSGSGSLPLECHGITAYRGCIVLYGQTTDPNNWYVSGVADPLSWDFGADPFETSAFAADVSDLGQNPDVVMAMIPWHDDLMIIGGAHSIRMVTGDPRRGGHIDVVTDAIGILSFDAWTIGKGGLVYFMGTDGFYVMQFGGKPVNISEGVLDSLLGNVQISETDIIVRYDPFASGVHIWLTPSTPGSDGVHVFFDEINGAFWPFEYGNAAHQPYGAAPLRGNTAATQSVILGCQDGYIRKHDRDAANDDGTAIDAWLEYGPILADGGNQEGIIRELMGEIATGSGTVSWLLRAALSAQELNDGLYTLGTRTGTLNRDGFNRAARLSLRFGAAQLKLTNAVLDEQFGIERFVVKALAGGRRRQFGT